MLVGHISLVIITLSLSSHSSGREEHGNAGGPSAFLAFENVFLPAKTNKQNQNKLSNVFLLGHRFGHPRLGGMVDTPVLLSYPSCLGQNELLICLGDFCPEFPTFLSTWNPF